MRIWGRVSCGVVAEEGLFFVGCGHGVGKEVGMVGEDPGLVSFIAFYYQYFRLT